MDVHGPSSRRSRRLLAGALVGALACLALGAGVFQDPPPRGQEQQRKPAQKQRTYSEQLLERQVAWLEEIHRELRRIRYELEDR